MKKFITTAYSESSNPLGFNPILQKFCEMICEFSKTVSMIYVIFCRSWFINNFVVKDNFSEPRNLPKLNFSRPICFKFPCTVKLEGIFSKIFFFIDLEFFSRLQNHSFRRHFLQTKLILYFFSSVII